MPFRVSFITTRDILQIVVDDYTCVFQVGDGHTEKGAPLYRDTMYKDEYGWKVNTPRDQKQTD